MPSFLGLRKKSKVSLKSGKSHTSNPSSDENSNQSSSTVNTAGGSSTPPSTLPSEKSSSVPPVPGGHLLAPPQGPQNSRYSITSGSGLTLSPSNSRIPPPTSPFAPRILSVSDNSWVHQKVLLIYGQIADPITQPIDGNVCISHHQESFPATNWPAYDSHFKALVHLQPGPNRIRLDFISHKVPAHNGPSTHSSWITINYLPLSSSPPLDLVILLAKDSEGVYDAVPERCQREGNDLESAMKKFKMAAYLWQAFTGEQMNRNSFGRRCFRFEEEWQPGTLSARDTESGQMRNEAKIHVIRTDQTVAELRDLDVAQQNPKASRGGFLFEIATEAVKKHFNPRPGQRRYVSVLLLDAHWDADASIIRGHAAMAGARSGVQLAVFGSQALQSYPSNLEEVIPAFTDCTRTDTNYVANHLNESGSNWEAANIGIGAHMRETGRLFGHTHRDSCALSRDYISLNRTFTCRESFSTRTKSPGLRLCLPKDESSWHRLDCLRFRYHSCFRLPSDPPLHFDDSVIVWSVDNGNVLVTAQTGVAFIEIHVEGSDDAKGHLEFSDGSGSQGLPKQVLLTESDLRSRVDDQFQKKKLKLHIHSAGQGIHVVDDFGNLTSKASRVKLANGQVGFRSSKLGASQMSGSMSEELLLANISDRKLMTGVRVFSGFALDGIEFIYEDSSTQMFGKKGGKPGGNLFQLDIRRGEVVTGFYVRAGLWIEGIQVLTSLGRKSEVFGKANGGSGHSLIPPRGYSIAGILGSCGQWVDGFALIITR